AGFENHRPRYEVRRRDARIGRRVHRLFGDRDIACGSDEFGELSVGDRVSLHCEAGHRGRMDRRFFRIEARRTHAERSAGQFDELGVHVLGHQSFANASANSFSRSSYGLPETSTTTCAMVPPVNANGALYALDTADPLLRPTERPAPARPNVPGCTFISASEPASASSMKSVASPSGVWLPSTVPPRT